MKPLLTDQQIQATALVKSRELQEHARAMNERAEHIEREMSGLQKGAIGVLSSMLAQGKEALAVKEKTGHGDFMLWIESNCDESYSTISAYMRAASKFQRAEDLPPGVQSLRECLSLLDKPDPSGEPKEPKQWPAGLEALGRVTKLSGFIERNPIKDWPDVWVEKLYCKIESIAEELRSEASKRGLR